MPLSLEHRVWLVHSRYCRKKFNCHSIAWSTNRMQGIGKDIFRLFRFHPIAQLAVKVQVMKWKRRRNRNFVHHRFFENAKKRKKLLTKKNRINKLILSLSLLSSVVVFFSLVCLAFFFVCRKFFHSYMIPTLSLFLYVAQLSSLFVCLFS